MRIDRLIAEALACMDWWYNGGSQQATQNVELAEQRNDLILQQDRQLKSLTTRLNSFRYEHGRIRDENTELKATIDRLRLDVRTLEEEKARNEAEVIGLQRENRIFNAQIAAARARTFPEDET